MMRVKLLVLLHTARLQHSCQLAASSCSRDSGLCPNVLLLLVVLFLQPVAELPHGAFKQCCSCCCCCRVKAHMLLLLLLLLCEPAHVAAAGPDGPQGKPGEAFGNVQLMTAI
jgi:hypothetical protein